MWSAPNAARVDDRAEIGSKFQLVLDSRATSQSGANSASHNLMAHETRVEGLQERFMQAECMQLDIFRHEATLL